MPITSSAKKAMKVAARRHEENLTQKTALRRTLKDARKANLSRTASVEMISKAQSSLDRAVKSNLLHKNTAGRLLSRLVKSQAATAPKTKAK